MTKPLVPADLMQSLLAADKAAAAPTTAKPKAGPGPKPLIKASTKPQGKSGVTHTRMSNRGK